MRILRIWPVFMLLHDLLVISRFKALLKHWTHIISGYLCSVQKLEVRDERRGSTAQLSHLEILNFGVQMTSVVAQDFYSVFPVDPTMLCGWHQYIDVRV